MGRTPAELMQATRLRQANRYPGQGQLRLYTGLTTPLTEVLNIDGSTPYIRQLSVNEAMSVSALSGVIEDVAFWLARVVSDTRHPATQSWEIGIQGVRFPVQCVTRGLKTAGSNETAMVYEYRFKGNP